MSKNPISGRLSYPINLSPSNFNDLGQTAVFKYDYPIAWIIQVFYIGFDEELANTGLVKCWFKGSGAVVADQWFYTSFDYYNGVENFADQSIVPYVGGTYKVYGKTIQGFFELVSDAETSRVVVVAVPQVAEYQGAQVEGSEINLSAQDGTQVFLPQNATHIAFCGNSSGDLSCDVDILDRGGSVLVTLRGLTYGLYVGLPSGAIALIQNDGATAYFGIKFYGVS